MDESASRYLIKLYKSLTESDHRDSSLFSNNNFRFRRNPSFLINHDYDIDALSYQQQLQQKRQSTKSTISINQSNNYNQTKNTNNIRSKRHQTTTSLSYDLSKSDMIMSFKNQSKCNLDFIILKFFFLSSNLILSFHFQYEKNVTLNYSDNIVNDDSGLILWNWFNSNNRNHIKQLKLSIQSFVYIEICFDLNLTLAMVFN